MSSNIHNIIFKLRQLQEKRDRAAADLERAKGAIDQMKTDLQEETGCSFELIGKMLEEMDAEIRRTESVYYRDLDALQNRWKRIMEKPDGD